jgi:hypothetical protein
VGYDLYMENVRDPGLAAKADEYERRWSEFMKFKYGDESPEAASAREAWVRTPRPTYFRFSIFGMGPFREAMESLGMLRYDGRKWPHDMGEIEQQEWVASTLDPCDALRGEKFCSNDGWLVTPEEIKAALATYDALDRGAAETQVSLYVQDVRYWREWIGFLRNAAEKAEGFRVW